MNYSIALDSRIGGRAVNQDRVAWKETREALVMVVADGMGGHLQGEVAAQLAVETVLAHFQRSATPRLADPVAFISSALRLAHDTIVRYARDCRLPLHASPRTTCIACVVQDGQACWAHSGDSRLYLIHGGKSGVRPPPVRADGPVTRTRDHSVVQQLVDEGRISREEMERHPLRHQVFSCLGGDVDPRIDVSPPVALKDGDVLALCTDGAWSLLHGQLAPTLSQTPLDKAVLQLMDVATASGGPKADNLTLLAMRWSAPEIDSDTQPEILHPAANRPQPALSDAEIDAAIEDIRKRLQRTASGQAR